MPMMDGEAKTQAVIAFPPQSITGNGTIDGPIVDLKDGEEVTFVFFTGAYTDGTHTPKLMRDTSATFAGSPEDVVDKDLLPTGTGQEAARALDAANQIKKLGYRGGEPTKKYLRLSVVSTGVTSGAFVGGTCIIRGKRHMPVS